MLKIHHKLARKSPFLLILTLTHVLTLLWGPVSMQVDRMKCIVYDHGVSNPPAAITGVDTV